MPLPVDVYKRQILVYAMLNYVGMLAGGAFTGMENGTDVLLLTVHTLFGNAGTLVLALVFLIACFNTCVSLLSCCGKYFNELFPQISFPHWVFLFAGLSMLISNVEMCIRDSFMTLAGLNM